MENPEKKYKQIKIISTIKDVNSSASLNNITGETTFYNLKQLIHIIANINSQNSSLYFQDTKIEIQEEIATIDEIFEGIEEISIEIRSKQNENTETENINPPCKNFGMCLKHPKEAAKTFCEICNRILCFKCLINKFHKNHEYDSITKRLDFKKANIEEKLNEFSKLFKNEAGYTKESLIKSKSENIGMITFTFDRLIIKLEEIRDFFCNFYIDYYNMLEKNLNSFNEDLRKITIKYNNFTASMKNFQTSSKNLNANPNLTERSSINYSTHLQILDDVEKELNSFLKNIKCYKELKDMKKEFDHDYVCHKNAIEHKLDIISSELIEESKLKRYDKLCQTENEENLIKNYLDVLVDNYDNIQTRIIMPIPLTKKLIQYDFEWDEFTEISLDKNNYTFKFRDNSNYLYSADNLIVTGGQDNFNREKSTSNSYLISVKEKKILELANMIKPRSCHSLIFNETLKLIFAISGLENSSVEIFFPNRNRWLLFMTLNKWRCYSNVLFVDDNKYMYVFAGTRYNLDEENNDNLFMKYERISLENFKHINIDKIESFENFRNYFDNYTFDLKYNTLFKLDYCKYGVIKLQDNKFLIFGGVNLEKDSIFSNEIKMYQYEQVVKDPKQDLKISAWTEDILLPEESSFNNQNFRYFSDNLIGQINSVGNLIIFNIETKKFEIRKKES